MNEQVMMRQPTSGVHSEAPTVAVDITVDAMHLLWR